MGMQTDWLIVVEGEGRDLVQIQERIMNRFYYFYVCEADGHLLYEDAHEDELQPLSKSPAIDRNFLVMHTQSENLGYYAQDACLDISLDFPVKVYSVAICEDGDNWSQAQTYEKGKAAPKFNGHYYGAALPEYIGNDQVTGYLYDEDYMIEILSDSCDEKAEELEQLGLISLLEKMKVCHETANT